MNLDPSRLESEEAIRARRSDTWNRMFARPLTEKDRLFWTLRDGGYTGWIDQDGMPVTGPEMPGEQS